MEQKRRKTISRRRAAPVVLLSILVLLVILGGSFGILTTWPSLGAQGADILRSIIGDDAVAKLEQVVFQIQDRIRQLEYRSGAEPSVPWEVSSQPTAGIVPSQTPEITEPPTQPVPTMPLESGEPTPAAESSPGPTTTPAPSSSPTPELAWCPAPLEALGSLEGEGQWQPYITGQAGQDIACRTFLQPDPERPYAVTAIVAFNLERSRLHYVIGIDEPVSDVKCNRQGRIPEDAKKPGVLLAVFNGGFKTRHGKFGTMVDGTVLIPAREGLGTLAIFQDGQVRIGAWGTEITSEPDMLTWRQNGPLVIVDGEINPHTADNSIADWGSTVDGKGVVATWRSAVGISQDGKTFYYVAGPSLTMPALAQALKAAGAYHAIQLDINNYWVHFGAITFEGDKPQTVPLFKEMNDNPNRYLMPYTRDFFYVTAR